MKFTTFFTLLGLVAVGVLAAASAGPEAARAAGILGLVAVVGIGIVDVRKSRAEARKPVRSSQKRTSSRKISARSTR